MDFYGTESIELILFIYYYFKTLILGRINFKAEFKGRENDRVGLSLLGCDSLGLWGRGLAKLYLLCHLG